MAKRIYLDYAATTPLAPEVFKDMEPYLKDKPRTRTSSGRGKFGNASSLHSFGQEALAAIDEAREKVAQFLGCSPGEIIFTSGATEADNFAIKGIVERYKIQNTKYKIHIITSAIEHPAVMETCESLKGEELEVTYIKPNREGVVSVQDIKKAIKENTVLVSIMYANNEVGTIQPIREIGKMVEAVNKNRGLKSATPPKPKIYFHTDAVQAINYLDCNIDHLHVDLLSLSGHKIYGPKGVGALYVRKGTPIKRIQDGGGHEYGLRAGTENVPGIVGLGSAINKIKDERYKIKGIEKLRDKLIDDVLKNIPDSKLNGSRKERLPNNANFSFKGIEGESLLISLDMEGFACSTGSACASKKLAPSHVLLAMGFDHLEAHSSLRITLGKYTTEKEIDKFLEILPKIIKKLRKISGAAGQKSSSVPKESCFE